MHWSTTSLRRAIVLFALTCTLITVLSFRFFRPTKTIDLNQLDREIVSIGEDSPQTADFLPPGACEAYGELRNVNFLHKSMTNSICKGVPVFTIINSAFPMCELQENLPEMITGPIRSNSLESYIRSPVTQKKLTSFVYNSSDYISNEIRNAHIFERDNVNMLIRLTQHFNAQSPVTFVDIGSNIGVYTLPALDIGVPVVALDANLRNLMRIQLSAQSNQISHNLHLVWNFVSSQVSLMYLHFPEDCNVGGATKFDRAVTDTIPVMSTTADSIASLISTRVIVMKVDIEGGEAAFFKTASNLFKIFAIPIVHMEWLERHMTDGERKFMLEFFTSRRYHPRSIRDLNRRVNVEDPRLTCDDLVWIRQDLLKDGNLAPLAA